MRQSSKQWHQIAPSQERQRLMNKKKVKEEYRRRIENRERVCISLYLIPKMVREDNVWRAAYYEGWTDEELIKLYELLYMSVGFRWLERDSNLPGYL